ncbi:MAG: hypothetical protein Q8S56_06370, partial [Polaromonas sp.]|nr:hypothetical protein [Polaromonas sp.]
RLVLHQTQHGLVSFFIRSKIAALRQRRVLHGNARTHAFVPVNPQIRTLRQASTVNPRALRGKECLRADSS